MMDKEDFSEQSKKGFTLDELFILVSGGLKTREPGTLTEIAQTEINENPQAVIHQRKNYPAERSISGPVANSTNYAFASHQNEPEYTPLQYRAFDLRFMKNAGKLRNSHENHEFEVRTHLEGKNNLALVTANLFHSPGFQPVFISRYIPDIHFFSTDEREKLFVFPLYKYPQNRKQPYISLFNQHSHNLNKTIVDIIAGKLGLAFVPVNEPPGKVCYLNNPEVRNDYKTTFTPLDVLDYVYAVLYSPSCRKRYNELNTDDFPLIPYPKHTELFWNLAETGAKLRLVHLLEPLELKPPGPQPTHDENIRIQQVHFVNYSDPHLPAGLKKSDQPGGVYINNTRLIAYATEAAWEFCIGAYKPAQEWLTDRIGKTLSHKDITHYQKIIAALIETTKLMKKIAEFESE